MLWRFKVQDGQWFIPNAKICLRLLTITTKENKNKILKLLCWNRKETLSLCFYIIVVNNWSIETTRVSAHIMHWYKEHRDPIAVEGMKLAVLKACETDTLSPLYQEHITVLDICYVW